MGAAMAWEKKYVGFRYVITMVIREKMEHWYTRQVANPNNAPALSKE